jgi:hypothetical protein
VSLVSFCVGPVHLNSGALGVMEQAFLREVGLNPVNAAILSRWDRLELPHGWLVAGCLFQTIWNLGYAEEALVLKTSFINRL